MDDDQRGKNARMLFELHQRQLGERRQKVHSISERTIAVFIAVGGWIIAKQPQVPNTIRWAFSSAIIILAASVCRMIWSNNNSYRAIAKVIRKLNDEFETFKEGAYVPGQALYPESWDKFGKSRI